MFVDRQTCEKYKQNLEENAKDLLVFIPTHINTYVKRRKFVEDTLDFLELLKTTDVSSEDLYFYCHKWDLSMESMFEDREEVD